MLYKELNLAEIRKKYDLDFAHYTFKPGQCSCCYGPKDLAKKYWKSKIIPQHDDYTYLLFKNADNGRGHVRSNDEIADGVCISWDFPEDKLIGVCKDLQEQLGDKYVVLMPKNHKHCIIITAVNGWAFEYYMNDGWYININEEE